MKRKAASQPLTLVRLLAWSRPAGALDLATFVEMHKAKEIPHNAATDRLAVAFERIIMDGIDPAAALNLQRKGRPREHIDSKTYRRKVVVAEFILDALEKDRKRGRVGRAMKEAAKRFRKSEARVREIWDEVGANASMLREAFRAVESARSAMRKNYGEMTSH